MNQLLFIALATFVSPAILAFITNWLTSKTRSRERQLDWEREDKKDRERIERANLVAQSLLDSNKQIAETAEKSHIETNQKLEVIRVDVNSNMTAAMKGELDATEGQLISLREIVELKRAAGTKPTKEALSYILSKEARISELKATLKDRLNHSERAAAAG